MIAFVRGVIRAATSALETSFNAKDVDKILTLYTENSVFMPPNKPLLRGRASLKGFYDGLMNGGSKDLKLTPADVAERTGTNERCVREWLNAQAAGGYVVYDAATQRLSSANTRRPAAAHWRGSVT